MYCILCVLYSREKVSHLSWCCCVALPCLMHLNYINMYMYMYTCSTCTCTCIYM